MSTLAQHFESGEQKAQKGYFRNLVMLTRVDGDIAAEESELLARIARRLSLTDEQVKEIKENVNDYPMIPPVGKEERYERFVQFMQMMVVDGEINEKEVRLVSKMGTSLGFREEELKEVYDAVLNDCKNGLRTSEIIEKLMK